MSKKSLKELANELGYRTLPGDLDGETVCVFEGEGLVKAASEKVVRRWLIKQALSRKPESGFNSALRGRIRAEGERAGAQDRNPYVTGSFAAQLWDAGHAIAVAQSPALVPDENNEPSTDFILQGKRCWIQANGFDISIHKTKLDEITIGVYRNGKEELEPISVQTFHIDQ